MKKWTPDSWTNYPEAALKLKLKHFMFLKVNITYNIFKVKCQKNY